MGAILIFIVACLLTSFAVLECNAEESLGKPEEVIRMALFIVYYPFVSKSKITKIVDLHIEDVEGLPIDTNNPAFGDEFKEATILLVGYGGLEGEAIRLVMEYDLSVDNETANEYALMISDEVMDVINKTGLPIYWTNTRIDNVTNTLIVTIDRGLLPRTLASIEGLLKYRPKDGFAGLVTEKLLRETYPWKEPSLGKLKYSLKKTSNGYRWDFTISFSLATELRDEEWIETLNLNSLLLYNGSIQPADYRNSTIIVEMPKKHKIPQGTYETSFETVYPAADVEERDGWLRVEYQVTAPIDNVVATVKVSKLKPGLEWDLIIAIIFIVAALAIVVTFFVKKKRKGGEKA